MKLNHRIFLGYFLVIGVVGLFSLKSISDELRPAVRQSMEETMVDTANLLAEIVKDDVLKGILPHSAFAKNMDHFLTRKMNADIWGLLKQDTSFDLYITDHQGIVLYDSANPDAIGEDYAQWNDVYRTLRGEYGARTTRPIYRDENSSIMYVAAPIKHEGQIIGVLSVYKPSISVLPFIQLSQRNILQAIAVLFAITLVLGWWFSHYLTRSTRALLDYVTRVEAGEDANLPQMKEKELARLGEGIHAMKHALEGKEYVENYVHALTHELKSPLSGIKGAAELLQEDLPSNDQERFLHNITHETNRIQNIVDLLLELATLEKQQKLENNQSVNLSELAQEQIASLQLRATAKSLAWVIDLPASLNVSGDPFLLAQALHNILDNAIDFSPQQGVITLQSEQAKNHVKLCLMDQGPGIPDYALDRVFERFYSLPRPQTGEKSTGLGLSFVKEVIKLHHGSLNISNQANGCCVCLTLPRQAR